jgi:3',5'-cyclic AMP phosphodiesterase CpdA
MKKMKVSYAWYRRVSFAVAVMMLFSVISAFAGVGAVFADGEGFVIEAVASESETPASDDPQGEAPAAEDEPAAEDADAAVIPEAETPGADEPVSEEPVGEAPITTFAANAETPGSAIGTADTTWRYLDDNTDPAGTGERTSWTLPDFDDSAWKSAKGGFGAKNGALASVSGYMPKTLLNQYISGTKDIPTFFFRTELYVADASAVSALTGSIVYDDAVIVYVNGAKIAAFDEPSGGFATNLSYGGSNADVPKTGAIDITDTSMLTDGVNTVAVELHNGRESSSDIYMDFVSLTASLAAPAATATVKNIALTIGARESERNITWYGDSTNAGKVQLAPKSAMTEGVFPASHREFDATKATSNVAGFGTYKAVLTDLAAGSEYVYRVGNEDGWSGVYAFKTPGTGDFSFLAAGDPQIGSSGNAGNDTKGWTVTLDKAAQWFPSISLLISLGDQVETSSVESQYDGFLSPAYLPSLTLAPNIGNHDTGNGGGIYKEHFSVPNESAQYGVTVSGGDYWYAYNGVLFMSINSNDRSTAEHKAFLSETIAAFKAANGGNDPLWKIVTFHHSIYSSASHTTDSDIRERRQELSPVFAELDIDAVLAGHDHVYTRSYMMNGANGTSPITEGYLTAENDSYAGYAKSNPGETLYITANSASGSKYYALKATDFDFVAAQNQENTPNITKVDVTADSLAFTTYRTGTNNVVSDVVDTFTLYRASEEPEPEDPEETLAGGVTLDLTGPSAVKTGKDVVYELTAADTTGLNYLSFTAAASGLTLKKVEALNGWRLYSDATAADVEMGLLGQDVLTASDAVPILKLTFTAGDTGEASVKLTQIKVGGIVKGESGQAGSSWYAVTGTFTAGVAIKADLALDINGDDKEDLLDFILAQYHYRLTSASASWNDQVAKADTNGDGLIDLGDLMEVHSAVKARAAI